jgi:hypothetical protein
MTTPAPAAALTLEGKDSYGNPRQKFADRIASADDAAFVKLAEERIWLSTYANNNPRSDSHWQVNACYDEAERRGKPELYTRAYDQACGTIN